MPEQNKVIEGYKCMNLSTQQIQHQLKLFKKGVAPLKLARPATINDGIIRLSVQEEANFEDSFANLLADKKPVKFVPASGAASRMFELLQQFYLAQKRQDVSERKKFKSTENKYLELFFQGLKDKKFAFYQDVKTQLKKENIDLDTHLEKADFPTILKAILDPAGLNYQHLPKAMVKFHSYSHGSRNPLEEHLLETSVYARDITGRAYLHLTMSGASQLQARKYLEEVKTNISKQALHFSIDFSEQAGWTNTIAIDHNNEPLKDEQNNLITRPGGHGALIENLNSIDGDVIFIKNIDNVAHENHIHDTLRFKKILGSYLLRTQQQIFLYLKILSQKAVESGKLDEISSFATRELFLPLPNSSSSGCGEHKTEDLLRLLNRPIRVCGMVKNQGEPGGGPFWVRDECNLETLQIVEDVQIDRYAQDQPKILHQSTHFNPVDIVCGIKDYQGNKFDLRRFVDHNQYMISEKFMLGKNVRILEYPGLWNGAMANWITIFIEVPVTTFNPVKTVNDLLRPLHQP